MVIFKFILLGLVFLLAVIAIAAALKPSQFRVQRTATFTARPAIVFDQVNDFHKWEAWSPWAKLDPSAKNSFTGPPAGMGSKFSWAGNYNVGAGSMTILDSHPDDSIRIQLDFIKPFKGTNTAEFTFRPEGDQTVVTWTMHGKNAYPARIFSLFVDCEKLTGGFFEKGLAQLKTITESPVAATGS